MRLSLPRLAMGLAAAAALAGASPGFAASCTIYEHRNFGGAHWTLHNGDDLRMVRQPQIGISNGIYRFLYQPSWNDKVSSFRVDRTCTLTLWENVNYGGHHFSSGRSYSYVGSAWNDKASEALCTCPGLPNL